MNNIFVYESTQIKMFLHTKIYATQDDSKIKSNIYQKIFKSFYSLIIFTIGSLGIIGYMNINNILDLYTSFQHSYEISKKNSLLNKLKGYYGKNRIFDELIITSTINDFLYIFENFSKKSLRGIVDLIKDAERIYPQQAIKILIRNARIIDRKDIVNDIENNEDLLLLLKYNIGVKLTPSQAKDEEFILRLLEVYNLDTSDDKFQIEEYWHQIAPEFKNNFGFVYKAVAICPKSYSLIENEIFKKDTWLLEHAVSQDISNIFSFANTRNVEFLSNNTNLRNRILQIINNRLKEYNNPSCQIKIKEEIRDFIVGLRFAGGGYDSMEHFLNKNILTKAILDQVTKEVLNRGSTLSHPPPEIKSTNNLTSEDIEMIHELFQVRPSLYQSFTGTLNKYIDDNYEITKAAIEVFGPALAGASKRLQDNVTLQRISLKKQLESIIPMDGVINYSDMINYYTNKLLQLNILLPARFSSKKQLDEIINNREKYLTERFKDKNIALVIYPRKDHNNAFISSDDLEQLISKQRVIYFEADSDIQWIKCFKDAVSKQKTNVLWVAGHGSSSDISYGNTTDESSSVDIYDKNKLSRIPQNLRNKIKLIVFESCSTGSRNNEKNMALFFRELFPNARVYAPNQPTGNAYLDFNDQGDIKQVVFSGDDKNTVFFKALSETNKADQHKKKST